MHFLTRVIYSALMPLPANNNTNDTYNDKPTAAAPLLPGEQHRSEPTPLLIVEDNPDLRVYLRELLGDYPLYFAEHGQAGLVQLEQAKTDGKPIALIVSDLMMPVMDGFAFLEAVKQDERYRHLPFIMLTAKANVRSKLHALRVGVDDYLLKPFEEEELRLKVRKLLERVPAREAVDADSGAPPPHSAADTTWLIEVETYLRKNIDDPDLKLERLAHDMHLSLRQTQRRIKQLTGLTAGQYLREMRLQCAQDLVMARRYNTVKETAAAVGFSNAAYFSRLYRERFGVSPGATL